MVGKQLGEGMVVAQQLGEGIVVAQQLGEGIVVAQQLGKMAAKPKSTVLDCVSTFVNETKCFVFLNIIRPQTKCFLRPKITHKRL